MIVVNNGGPARLLRNDAPKRGHWAGFALAGGLGAAGTAWQQGRNTRRENFLRKRAAMMDVANGLIQAVENDYSLSPSDKQQILMALARLDDNSQDQLYRLIRRSLGAGAGVLIMRFLGAKGLLPMLAGGIVGAMLGGIQKPRQRYNAMGQLSY